MKSDIDPDHPIWRAWLAGKAQVGRDHKPHSRVTVEPGWWLNTTNVAGSRAANKLPIRYFQRADNGQLELEIPGVRSIDVDYDIDQDVATLNVQLTNNRFDPDYGSSEWQNNNGDFGRPGYMTPDRGSMANPWGYEPNEWSGLLVRNALLRCLRQTELVRLSNGDRRPASEMVGKSFRVLTLADNEIVEVDARAEWAATEECFAIETESGRHLEANARHPLWTARMTSVPSRTPTITPLGWTPLGQIGVGKDWLVAVPERFPVEDPVPMNQDAAAILGYLIGNGSITQDGGAISLTMNESPQTIDFCSRVRDLGDHCAKYHVADDPIWPQMMLSDIRDYFEETGKEKVPSVSLAGWLSTIRDRPWGDMNGKPLNAHVMARILRTVGVRRYGSLHDDEGRVRKHYRRVDFDPAWRRYLEMDATPTMPPPRQSDPTGDVWGVSGGVVRHLLREHGLIGCRYDTKFIPAALFKADQGTLAVFLSCLYSTDGHASTGNRRDNSRNNVIAYTTVSERLAADLQELLLRLGINARIEFYDKCRGGLPGMEGRDFSRYTVVIHAAQDILDFCGMVGTIVGKEDQLRRVREWAEHQCSRGGVRKWRQRSVPAGLRWERVKSIESVGVDRTVGICVPEHHTYLSTFWEHNTYEGYGGQEKTLDHAIADGNLVLTGVWLVDDVPIRTGQGFQLQARNMGKLLVDQYIYPPLVPAGLPPVGDYPMSRARYAYSEVFTPTIVYGSLAGDPLFRILRMERDVSGDGYWLCGTDGGIFTYGRAHFRGSIDSLGITIAPSTYPSEGITGMARSQTGDGYWLVKYDGAIYSFGDAEFHGSMSLGASPAHPIVGIEGNENVAGYWLAGDDGGVFAFGDAGFYGSLPPLVAGARIVDIAAAVDGLGYFLCDTQGHVYAYGSAQYQGGLDSPPSGGDIVAMDVTPTGDGYILVGNDGGVFAFGDAEYNGSIPGLVPPIVLNDPVSDIVLTVDGGGYWLTAEDGGVFAFGNAHFYGSMPGSTDTFFEDPGNYTDYCVDEDTEILTQRGWLTLDEVTTDDRTLALDPDTGSSRWEQISAVNVFPARRRDMTLMEGTVHSSLTTPNHRWLVETADGRRRWTTTEAMNMSDRVLVAAPRADLPTRPVHDDFLVELVAWWYTEGSRTSVSGPVRGPRRRGGQLSQSEDVNPAFVKRIRECLHGLYGAPGPMKRGRHVDQEEVANVLALVDKQLPITHIERVTGVDHRTIKKWIASAPLTGPRWNEYQRPNGVILFNLNVAIAEELERWAPDKVPSPEFLTSLTQDQLDLFIQTSLDADNAGKSWVGLGHCGFAQTDRRRTGAFQYACTLRGYATSLSRSARRGRSDMWNATICRRNRIAPKVAARCGRRFKITTQSYSGRVWCPSIRSGNWLARRDGKVYFTGNTDIIKDLALYAGFHLYDGGATDGVYGIIESTGIYAPDQDGNSLDPTFFDKLPVIDPMNKIKEVVGMALWVDDEGGLIFREPNFWESGNWLTSGGRVDTVPVIDEKVNLTSYQLNTPDKDLRSEIIISSEDPDSSIAGTVTTSYTPATATELRGMVRPAMWINEAFVDNAIQQTMAELIALHIYFKSRLGTVTCMGNPLLSIDDQVQIVERETFELNSHYVRRIHRTHDRKTGSYTMDLTTNVLSPPGDWAVVKPDGSPSGSIVTNRPAV